MPNLWPRTVTIHRASHQGDKPQGGRLPYGGMAQDKRSLVAGPVPANIESRAGGRANPTGLPGDTMASAWFIRIPRGAVPEGVIRSRDIATDDLGRVFHIQADDCHNLGWTLMCDRLET